MAIPQERHDIKCPDCGARMALKLGRFGRFYGCTQYNKTGCKGSCSALDDGAPSGLPIPRDQRFLRRQSAQLLHKFFRSQSGKRKYHLDQLAKIVGGEVDFEQMDNEKCKKVMQYIVLQTKKEPTVWDRLSLECLSTDD